jgi:hypothetical protein
MLNHPGDEKLKDIHNKKGRNTRPDTPTMINQILSEDPERSHASLPSFSIP